MTITTAKERQNSNRFVLVRMTPARHVSDLLASAGAGIYTMTFNMPIARVERNGIALTETTSNPPGSNDQWYHDETTGTFKVKLASGPDSDTNVICIFFYLFFTDGPDVKAHEDPADTSTPLRLWEPRLRGEPNVNQAFNDVLEGTFSVRASSIQITNADDYMQAFLTDDDSFYRKEVRSWLCIVDVSNIQPIFSGRSTSLSISSDVVTIAVSDAFAELKQSAYMGDTTQEAYFRKESGSFPNMDAKDHNTPCPYIFGHSVVAVADAVTAMRANGSIVTQQCIDPKRAQSGINTNHTPFVSTTVNREWGICRVGGDFKTLNFGTPTSKKVKDNVGGNATGSRVGPTLIEIVVLILQLDYSTADHNLEIGDSFSFSGASFDGGNTHYADVIKISTDRKTVYCRISSAQGEITDSADVSITTLNSNQAPAIVIYEPAADLSSGGVTYTIPHVYSLCYPRDFTYTITTLASGNKYMKITLANSFETGIMVKDDGGAGSPYPVHPGLNTLDPTQHVVAFRVTQTDSGDPQTHANALATIIEASGLTADAATFAQADADLDARVSFTIPAVDERDFGSYLDYAQMITSSTLGYLSMNSDQEIEYRLLDAPAAADAQTDNVMNLESIDVSYDDIDTELRAENPHYMTDVDVSTPIETSNKAKYLHGVDRRSYFKHVLTDISGRLADALAFRSNRRVTYSLGVATQLADASLGDDVTLETSRLLGGDTTRNAKITSIQKSSARILVQVMDLLGL